MKKKLPISPVAIFFLVVLLVLVIYCLYYLFPTRNEITSIHGEIAVNNAEADIYRPYVDDTSELEAQIAEIEDEIAQLHADGYVNDSSVSLTLVEAVQEYNISLSAVSLGEPTKIDGHRALPINISMSGSVENVIRFISYFENDSVGSYIVRSSSLQISGATARTTVVLYLCTPAA